MSVIDPYRVLQVVPTAEQEVLNAAFRALALKYHPDRDPSTTAARRMAELNAAYALVRDPAARGAFDAATRMSATKSGVTTSRPRRGPAATTLELGGHPPPVRPLRGLDAARPRSPRSGLPPLALAPRVGPALPHRDLPDPGPAGSLCGLTTPPAAKQPLGLRSDVTAARRLPGYRRHRHAPQSLVGAHLRHGLRGARHRRADRRLRDALRAAYHHGGWGFEDGFEPTEETSYRRTVEMDQAAIAELGVGPMPDSFFRRLSELFLLVGTWHIFPDVLPALDALKLARPAPGGGQQLGLAAARAAALAEAGQPLRHAGGERPRRIREAAPRDLPLRAEPDRGAGRRRSIHVGDHLDADVTGARSVGIEGVLIDRRGRYDADAIPADVPVIHTLSELLPMVDARLQRASA